MSWLWLISDGQWEVLEGLLPPRRQVRGGLRRDRRQVLGGRSPAVRGWRGVVRPSAVGRGGRCGNATAPGRGTARWGRTPGPESPGR